MKQTGSLTTLLCLVLLLASHLPAAAGDHAVLESTSLDLESTALQLPLAGTLRLEGLQLEAEGAPAVAQLERFRVFAPDAQVVVHGANGDTYQPVPKNAYFQGRIEGAPGSRVVFSVLEAGGARGLITNSAGRMWIMGNARGAKAASDALLRRYRRQSVADRWVLQRELRRRGLLLRNARPALRLPGRVAALRYDHELLPLARRLI